MQGITLKGAGPRLAVVATLAMTILLATAAMAFAGTNIGSADALTYPQPITATGLDGAADPMTSAVYYVDLQAGDVLLAAQNGGEDVIFAAYGPSATDIYAADPLDAVEASWADLYYKAPVAGRYYFAVLPFSLADNSKYTGDVAFYAGVMKNTVWTLDGGASVIVPFDTEIYLSSTLTTAGAPVAYEPVSLLRQYPGGKIEKIATLWSDQNGYCDYLGLTTGQRRRATYTFAYEGADPNWTTGETGLASAYVQQTWTPKAFLTASGPSAARRNRTFTVAGYLMTRHAASSSSTAVRVYLQRYERGRWVTRKTYIRTRLVNTTYTGGPYYLESASKWSASVTVPYTGSWRVRAYHADSDHAATYKESKAFPVRY